MQNNDQVLADILNENKSGNEQSGGTPEGKTGEENTGTEGTGEQVTLEQVVELIHGLQKGYTTSRQDIAALKDVLQKSRDQGGEAGGEDEYLTVKKFLELQEKAKHEDTNRDAQANEYIDSTLEQLRIDGLVKTKEDEESLLNFAVKHKETDLLKAAQYWKDVREAEKEALKKKAATEKKQEEGSKVGSSDRAPSTKGISYDEIRRKGWFD